MLGEKVQQEFSVELTDFLVEFALKIALNFADNNVFFFFGKLYKSHLGAGLTAQGNMPGAGEADLAADSGLNLVYFSTRLEKGLSLFFNRLGSFY